MPERSTYDEAILLSTARLKVPDADLQKGAVEKFKVQTAIREIERPWGLEGGFAVVYKFRTQSGRLRALRCFRVAISSDMRDRYERIGLYFSQYIPSITAQFIYHEQGILLREDVQGQRQSNIYPLIDMEWIDGLTLLEWVDRLCARRDQAGLAQLVKQWSELVMMLRDAHIAHGDLAATNIMVRENGQLVLVDYDGVYIPEFAAAQLQTVVLGQKDYQHPGVFLQKRSFDEYMDDFSALVIYIALLALQYCPSLWEKYTQHDIHGELLNLNLLFVQQDFIDPDHSQLIRDIECIGETQLQRALEALRHACTLSAEQVRFPEELVDSHWEQKRALARFQLALVQKRPQQIVAAYDAQLLDASKHVSPWQREILALASRFVQACQNDDDEAIVDVADEILNFSYRDQFMFSPQERQRIGLARRRKTALALLRLAIMSKDIRAILHAYNFELHDSKAIQPEERELVQIAKRFTLACYRNDDEEILAIAQELQHTYAQQIVLTKQEQERIECARQRRDMQAALQQALASKRARTIAQHVAEKFEKGLSSGVSLKGDEQTLLHLARQFVQAYDREDDHALLEAVDALQASPYQQSIQFTAQEQQRIAKARKQQAALKKFRLALWSKQLAQIAHAYDGALDCCTSLSRTEQELLHNAHDFIQAIRDDNDQAIVAAAAQLENASYRHLFSFTTEEQQRLHLAHQHFKEQRK